MSSFDQALSTFEPISLVGANDVAELQTRTDRKYLVDEATLGELLDALAPTLRVLEIDGEHSCNYRSTYFDTADLALYRAAVQGRRQRYKVRSRTYGDTGPCFLEVKAKGRRGANVKSRIGYCRHDHNAITTHGHDFIEEITGRRGLASTLLPVLATEYKRSTLIDPTSRTRFTFDRGLRCTDEEGGEASLDAIVVETKSARAPSPADQWLWRHHVRPTKISKFGTGLAAIRPELPANKWHRIIARHWQTRSGIPAGPFLTEPFECLQRGLTLGEDSGGMTSHPPPSRTPGSDPLLGLPSITSRVARSTPESRNTSPGVASRGGASSRARRQHPARGTRALALAASVVATGAVTAALGYSEGAWGADSTVAASGSTDQLATSAATVDSSAPATSTIAADTAAATTPSTTASSPTTAATTAPETTQPADVTAASSGYTDGVYLGAAEYTEWGDVQVQVTISDGGIVDIAAVQYPTGRKSSDINEQAIPMLEADAVALQSADLEIVSGATYTSRTYADSLQAALDEAALASAREATSS